jgi:hypothetical protein
MTRGSTPLAESTDGSWCLQATLAVRSTAVTQTVTQPELTAATSITDPHLLKLMSFLDADATSYPASGATLGRLRKRLQTTHASLKRETQGPGQGGACSGQVQRLR